MPLINIKGTNTAMVVRDELSIGVIISVAVSYTHLDVYKRQVQSLRPANLAE